MEIVEKVCSKVIILHRGKVVADDSVEHLRDLKERSSLEQVFSELAAELRSRRGPK